MTADMQKVKAFADIEKAAKSFPQSGGPRSILVFNNQGLPILKYAVDKGVSDELDAKESAIGVELVRSLLNSAKTIRDKFLSRVIFFYEDELISFEKYPPFILLITWSPDAFKTSGSNEIYIKRLIKTLQAELT